MNEYLVGIHGDMKEKQKQRQRENREVRILLRVEVRVRSLLVLDLEFIIKVSNPWGLNFLLLFFFLYFFIKINLSFILFYHRQTKNPVREISVSLRHEFLNVTICSLSLSLSLSTMYILVHSSIILFFLAYLKIFQTPPFKKFIIIFLLLQPPFLRSI